MERLDTFAIGRGRRRLKRSVIIRAAHVIAAFFADQLAFQFGEPRRTDRAVEHGLVFVLARGHGLRIGFAHDVSNYSAAATWL